MSLWKTTFSVVSIRITVIILAVFTVGSAIAADVPEPPRLVLQITVDQLRGDLPERYLAEMGQGGFHLILIG